MKKISFLMIFVVVIVSGCSLLSLKTEQPPVDFDINYLNQQITLRALDEWNDFRISHPVGLLLEMSAKDADSEIVFPSGYNLRIFIKQNGRWVEIQQEPTVRPPENITLSSKSPATSVSFFPDLPDRTSKCEVRVYVFGDMQGKDGNQQVGAFVDFNLAP